MHIDDFIFMNSFLITPYLPMSAHIIFMTIFFRLLCFLRRLLLSLSISRSFFSLSLSLSLSLYLFLSLSLSLFFLSFISFFSSLPFFLWYRLLLGNIFFFKFYVQSLLCISWRACWMLGYSVYCPSGYVLPGLEVRTLSSF